MLPCLVAVASGSVALWHVLPLLLWNLRLEDQLRRQGEASRLHSRLERLAPAARPRWSELVVGELTVRAPIAIEEQERCGECAARCLLRLDGGGTLAIFDAPPPESYREALDRFAPDVGDLSLLRSSAGNWRTIDALTDRVRARPPPPSSFRYLAEHSRGVVTEFVGPGFARDVIYPYAHDGLAARVVGLTGLPREQRRGILGTLRVDADRSARPATCVTAPTGGASLRER